jgi:prepilin-type N-terminal cleavage/methylation domain-containing protein
MYWKSNRGFTLAELLIAVVIIGISASILFRGCFLAKEISKSDQPVNSQQMAYDYPGEHVLICELRQEHHALDFDGNIKDNLNKIQIAIPVSESFFNSVTIGTDLIPEDKKFRKGSAILEGRLSEWCLVVIDKVDNTVQ